MPIRNLAVRARHRFNGPLANRLWDVSRPLFKLLVATSNRQGIPLRVNGTDLILIDPRLYSLPAGYEPEVWKAVMDSLRPGDLVVDVGASFGLYSVAAARRLGVSGRVLALEPDPESFQLLLSNIRLNRLERAITALEVAAGARSGHASFLTGLGTVSRIVPPEESSNVVELCTLAELCVGEQVAVMKVDVEGYEHQVLEGAADLLRDRERRPRVIFIEIHPYAWPALETSGAELLVLLGRLGYRAQSLDGRIPDMSTYGEIIAYPVE